MFFVFGVFVGDFSGPFFVLKVYFIWNLVLSFWVFFLRICWLFFKLFWFFFEVLGLVFWIWFWFDFLIFFVCFYYNFWIFFGGFESIYDFVGHFLKLSILLFWMFLVQDWGNIQVWVIFWGFFSLFDFCLFCFRNTVFGLFLCRFHVVCGGGFVLMFW